MEEEIIKTDLSIEEKTDEDEPVVIENKKEEKIKVPDWDLEPPFDSVDRSIL